MKNKKTTIYAQDLLKRFEAWLGEIIKNRKLKKTIGYVLIFLIIAIGAGAYYMFHDSRAAEAGWWNDSWQYRKPIAVSNSGSAQSNTQVKVLSNVDLSADVTAGKIQADLDDLRFTDINGELLKYWIEDSTNNSVDIWAFVPSVPTSGATVYMYYGNSNAGTGQSAVGTSDYPGVSCKSIALSGVSVSGTYYIDPTGQETLDKFQTYCDLSTSSGGWTRCLKQDMNAVDYNRASIGKNLTDTRSDTVLPPMSWIEQQCDTPTGTELLLKGSRSGATSFAMKGTLPADAFKNSDGSSCISTVDLANGNVARQLMIIRNLTNVDGTACIGGGSSSRSFWASSDGNNSHHIEYTFHGADQYRRIGSTDNNETVVRGIEVFLREATVSTTGHTITAAAPATEEKGTGPIGYWSFDEGYGTTANDATANKNNGTITNAVWKTEDQCASGKCLYFDETGDYVNLGGNDELTNNVSDITISAWVRLNAELGNFSDNYEIISNESYRNYGYLFRVENTTSASSAGKIHLRFSQSGASTAITAASNAYPNDHSWHYLVGVKSGSAGYIYLDGKLVYSGSGLSNPVNASGSTYIGGNGQLWNGFLDEVKVYNYARSAAQIKMDYSVGLAGSGGSQGAAVSAGKRSPQWISSGLVGWWKMDEASWNGTAGEVKDWSGNGNNGVRVGDATTAAGKFGNGGSFAGTSDLVDCGTGSSLNATNAITLATWVYPTGSGYRGIISKMDASTNGNGYILRVDPDNNINFILNNSGSRVGEPDDVSISLNTWTYVVATFDGINRRIYFNGELQNTFSGGAIGSTSYRYIIGAYEWGVEAGPYYFTGKLDETRIYNRALSDREVRDLYSYAPGPVAYWNMEEGSGSTVINDISGNGNTGTLYPGTAGMNIATSSMWTTGKFGKGLKFDGTDDYVVAPVTGSSGYTNASMSAWIKTTDSGSSKRVLGTGWWMFYLNRFDAGKFIPIFDGSSGDNNASQDSTTTINDGLWHFLAATNDGSTTRIYVDGKQENSYAETFSANAIEAIGIGADRSGNSPVNGIIDDVKIYNYVRTQKQVVEDMNGGHPAGGSPVGSQVGYWKFDEGYGTVAHNSGSAGSALDGTIINPVWDNNGKFNKALSFDGASNYVQTSSPFSISTTDDWTVSAWIFWKNNLGGADTILGISGANENECIYLHGANTLTDVGWRVEKAGNTTRRQRTSSGKLTTNTWHYVALSKVGNNDVRVFIDGAEDTSAKVAQGSDTLPNTFNETWIGRIKTGDVDLTFNGLIDEVKIYNYALTVDEVKLDYNKGASMKIGSGINGDVSDDAVGWWKLDDGTGAAAINSGTAGITYNGTLAGNTSWTTGQVNGAASFDGTGDYISVTDGTGSPLDMTSAMTVSGWFYGNSLGGGIVCKGPSDATESLRFHVTSNYIYFDYGNIGQYADAAPIITTGQWHHFAGTVVAGAGGKIYLDGTEISSYLHQNASPNPLTTNDNPLTIGGCWTGYSFNGKMDNIKIYNYARSSSQIKADAVTNSLNPVLPGAPVGEWKFEEGYGISAFDTSGNSKTGTLTNMDASTDWVPGKYGKALDFDGTDDYVSIPNSIVNLAGNFSLSLYTKPRVSALNPRWFTLIDGANNFEIGYIGATNKVTVRTRGASIQTTIGISLNQWHHIEYVMNSGTASIYIDGINQAIESGGYGSDGIYSAIGGGYGSGYDGNGLIDEVKIYNYARTQAQIAWDYNKGKPVGWWKMDECQGGTIHDSSGFGNNGTWYGTGGGTQTSVGTCTTSGTAWYNGRTGKRNASLNFDGTNDYVSKANVSLDFSRSFSFGAWIKTSTLASYKGIMSKWSDLATAPYISIHGSGGSIRFECSDVGSNTRYLDWSNAISGVADSQWHFIFFTYDRNYVKSYKDGVYQNTSTAWTYGCGNTAADTFFIGTFWAGSFNGQIDDVRVYNYALTASQIKDVYGGGAVRFGQ